MEPFLLKDEKFFFIDEWVKENTGLVAGFTTKLGGCSTGEFSTLNMGFHVHDSEESVCKNRSLLANGIQFPVTCWVGAQQTHGTNILKLSKKDRGKGSSSYDNAFKNTDGFFTRDRGILLTLCFADCVPLFFYAPKKEAIGIAHAGWKGTVAGIGEKMVNVFKEENIDPQEISVVIGPSICKKCYIVDDRVMQFEFVKKILEDVEEKPYNLINGNQYNLDLKELNRQILISSGVLNKNISITNYCTSCHQSRFFSHRRDKGCTGRMMGFIGWKEDFLH